MLSPSQQLELYTPLQPPEWLRADARFQVDPVAFLNAYRGNWAFSPTELQAHLRQHPYLVDDYLRHCAGIKHMHDNVVLERDNEGFVVYWTDHGTNRDPQYFSDETDAVLVWLECRYMN